MNEAPAFKAMALPIFTLSPVHNNIEYFLDPQHSILRLRTEEIDTAILQRRLPKIKA